MNKTLLAALALAVLLMTGTASALTETLIADGGDTRFDAGDVEVTSDGTTLTVRITVNQAVDPWELVESHVHVAGTAEQVPQKNGNPRPGKFDYHDDDPEATTVTVLVHEYTIPLADVGLVEKDPFVVAVHTAIEWLEITPPVGDLDPPDILHDETGWADGEDFLGSNWAMYIDIKESDWVVSWDVRDNWTLAVSVTVGPSPGGTYVQYENITSQDFVTGNFSGTGDDSPAPGPFTWNIVGNVTGSNINWTRPGQLPVPSPGYISTFTGTIAGDGSMSGTWFDNLIPVSQSGHWNTTSGTATPLACTLP